MNLLRLAPSSILQYVTITVHFHKGIIDTVPIFAYP